MRVVKIVGTGSFLPGASIDNDLAERIFGTSDHYLSSLLGIKRRYWATDPHTFELKIFNSKMAAQAIDAALKVSCIEPKEVDLLVVNSCTPDYLMPPMAPIIQEELQIPECAVVELRSGCVGAITALSVASQFLQTGAYRTAVVVASELSSSYTFIPIREKRELSQEERINGLMFGDGAGALVLIGADGAQAGLEGLCLNSVGVGRQPGMIFEAGGSRNPITGSSIVDGTSVIHHDHRAVRRWGRELSVRAVKDLCKQTGCNLDEIDYYIFPQANPDMLRQDMRELDELGLIPKDRVVMNVDRVGNTVSAGLYIALDDLVRSRGLETRVRVALIAGEASKWLYGAALISM